jgi:hypothetical protein
MEESVGEPESIDNDQDPGPDIESSQLPSEMRPEGTRVTFGGDKEKEQAYSLSEQMMRSVEHQLHTASEHIKSIRWIETDGSKHIDGKGELAITEFEMVLSNGKTFHLEGPIINMRIEGGPEFT